MYSSDSCALDCVKSIFLQAHQPILLSAMLILLWTKISTKGMWTPLHDLAADSTTPDSKTGANNMVPCSLSRLEKAQ